MLNKSGEGLFPSWVLWVIGPVTVLAAALIILAVVLGIRAGQRQIEIQRRQQVGIALQRALDFQSEGRLQDAVAEYRRVLILDPSNETALAGIQNIVSIATGEGAPPAAPQSASPPGAAPPGNAAVTPAAALGLVALTSTPGADSPEESAFRQALAVFQSGRWREAVDLLTALREQAPDFRRDQVEEMLYSSYVTLAAEAEQSGDLRGAVAFVDQALALRPNSTALRQARTLAASYVAALESGDPGETVRLLEEIYRQDPGYRDVAQRLQAARLAYGDRLALEKEWCLAEEQYSAAIEISVTAGAVARRDEFARRCAALQELLARGNVTPSPTATRATSPTPVALVPTPTPVTPSAGAGVAETATPTPTPAPAVAAAPAGGRIVYSALDPINGRSLIYLRSVAPGSAPVILFEGASQPAFRPDTQRLAFRNLRDDSRGISTIDPATGLVLRFTNFAEDAQPRWNAEGNLIAFASTREGDRRSRIYVLWADVDNQATGMGFGTSPSWHPAADRLAYQGCDETGNNCGLWTMTGSGADRRGLTNVAADTRPAWSPNGAFIAFMSEGRDGNAEIYRVDTATGAVTRLTNDPALDVSPTVSPDGGWVAFFSNRGGAWGVWAVPSNGGDAKLLFPVEGGLGNWTDHQLHWVN